MEGRQKKESKDKIDFLPIVKKCLTKLVNPESDRDIIACVNKFNKEMRKAHNILTSTQGLDITEEEQLQRIQDLKQAIEQKKALLEECIACFESWKEEQ